MIAIGEHKQRNGWIARVVHFDKEGDTAFGYADWRSPEGKWESIYSNPVAWGADGVSLEDHELDILQPETEPESASDPTEQILDACWRLWVGDGPGEIPRRFREALPCEQRDFEAAIGRALEMQQWRIGK